MSPETDRIPVPTNGRRPHPPLAPPAAAGAPGPAAPGYYEAGPSELELSVAFSPRQLAIGFGILASLVLLVGGLARRRDADR
jgi:hypothetical protein